jgi:hypothetical protein
MIGMVPNRTDSSRAVQRERHEVCRLMLARVFDE